MQLCFGVQNTSYQLESMYARGSEIDFSQVMLRANCNSHFAIFLAIEGKGEKLHKGYCTTGLSGLFEHQGRRL